MEKHDHWYADDADETDDGSLGLVLRRACRLASANLDSIAAKEALSGSQCCALMLLQSGRCSTSAELARAIVYNNGAMTRLVDGLVARGFVTRHRTRTDRRILRLALTKAGSSLADRTRNAVSNGWDQRLIGWTWEDVDTLKTLLRRLNAEMESEVSAPN